MNETRNKVLITIAVFIECAKECHPTPHTKQTF